VGEAGITVERVPSFVGLSAVFRVMLDERQSPLSHPAKRER
jgi:hypothetical protein